MPDPKDSGSLSNSLETRAVQDRITALETTMAYQEQAIKDMNHWLFQHQKTIEILESTVKQLKEKVKDLQSAQGKPEDPEQTAPHYIHR